MTPVCHTQWSALLVTQDGTQDEDMLLLIDRQKPRNAARAFSLYARLHEQLSTRSLDNIAVRGDTPHPFRWDHIFSNDFLFEDCMRIVCEAMRITKLQEDKTRQNGALFTRRLSACLGMFTFLMESAYVQSLQSCPQLPFWLKSEHLRVTKWSASVSYVRSFAEGYYDTKHALEMDPEPQLPIRHWLAQHGNDEDKAKHFHTQGEILFQRAIRTDDSISMRCARCYALKAMDVGCQMACGTRIAERLRYFEYFGVQHFPDVFFDAVHECVEVYPDEEFNAEFLLSKAEKPFSWTNHADDYIFTL